MRKIPILSMAVILLFMLCPLLVWAGAKAPKATYVEVMYFHGKVRCATCNDIEACTEAVLTQRFASEMKKHRVVYKVVDISLPQNRALAKRFQISWSSLVLVQHKAGRDHVVNLTNYAFSHIDNKKAFMAELTRRIRTLLK